mmetsp:Transcript_29312/g.86850  ORF Transcript_29312/g.86850 Transcript_29312/m.86850 type:complete len:251 (+) Transcript_29312:676-1428(+)
MLLLLVAIVIVVVAGPVVGVVVLVVVVAGSVVVVVVVEAVVVLVLAVVVAGSEVVVAAVEVVVALVLAPEVVLVALVGELVRSDAVQATAATSVSSPASSMIETVTFPFAASPVKLNPILSYPSTDPIEAVVVPSSATATPSDPRTVMPSVHGLRTIASRGLDSTVIVLIQSPSTSVQKRSTRTRTQCVSAEPAGVTGTRHSMSDHSAGRASAWMNVPVPPALLSSTTLILNPPMPSISSAIFPALKFEY